MLKRGALVVLEGCDRSGKTTQVQKLVQRLNDDGLKTKMLRFPERTTGIGKMINEYLKCDKDLDDHAIHLLFSANRWEMVDEMKKALDSGENILVDRYAYSGVAFSAAKDGLDIEWCKQPDVGLPEPDLVCFLDVSEEMAKKRADFGGERYEKTEFQARVRNNYDKLSDSRWKYIDADKTLEQVHECLYGIVKDQIERPRTKLGRLWMDRTEPHDSGISSCSSQEF